MRADGKGGEFGRDVDGVVGALVEDGVLGADSERPALAVEVA